MRKIFLTIIVFIILASVLTLTHLIKVNLAKKHVNNNMYTMLAEKKLESETKIVGFTFKQSQSNFLEISGTKYRIMYVSTTTKVNGYNDLVSYSRIEKFNNNQNRWDDIALGFELNCDRLINVNESLYCYDGYSVFKIFVDPQGIYQYEKDFSSHRSSYDIIVNENKIFFILNDDRFKIIKPWKILNYLGSIGNNDFFGPDVISATEYDTLTKKSQEYIVKFNSTVFP